MLAEMGVVDSAFGPVAAGTLLAGIAAGFRPRVVSWPTVESNKRLSQYYILGYSEFFTKLEK